MPPRPPNHTNSAWAIRSRGTRATDPGPYSSVERSKPHGEYRTAHRAAWPLANCSDGMSRGLRNTRGRCHKKSQDLRTQPDANASLTSPSRASRKQRHVLQIDSASEEAPAAPDSLRYHLIPVAVPSDEVPARGRVFKESVKVCTPKSPSLSDEFSSNFASF